jgi:hypothetical protein
MLWHLAFPLVLRTVGVGWEQFLGSRGLQSKLACVGVDHHELLLVEQYAVGGKHAVSTAPYAR